MCFASLNRRQLFWNWLTDEGNWKWIAALILIGYGIHLLAD